MKNLAVRGDAGLVDVHAHCLPESYLAAVAQAGLSSFDGGYSIPRWSPAGALRFMDRNGITAQVLSVSSPPVGVLAADHAPALARRVNEQLAAIVADHPHRFRATVTLPLPDVPATVTEIHRTLDDPTFVAVTLFTNYHGVYLGDPLFDPVFAALDDRHAVALLHPTSPGGAEHTRLGRPAPIVEFPIDTTRAVTHLLYQGTLRRFPHLHLVVPHAGAAVPVLAWRIARFAGYPATHAAGATTAAIVLDQLRRLYFDLAMSLNPHALAPLLELVDHTRILFGSDYPFAPASAVGEATRGLTAWFTLDQQAHIRHRNATTLFPALSHRTPEPLP